MQTRIYFALFFQYSISPFSLILIFISFYFFSFSLFDPFPPPPPRLIPPDSSMSLCGFMEFFLELVVTITIPLLLACFLTKLLSVAAAGEQLAPVGFDVGFGSRIRKPSVVVAVGDSVGGGDEIVESKQDSSTGIVESRGETESECDGAVIDSVRTVEEREDSDSDHRGGDCGGEVAEKVIDESSVRTRSGDCGGEVADKVFDESSVRARSEETGICRSDGVEAFESDRSKESGGVKEEGLAAEEIFVEDDDWEGIERTELEKQFEAAVKFVKIHDNDDPDFGNELKMRLSGLHKIAIEGPCRESTPMASKIFARFKWNTCKELGNMSPEVAMESYINLVSENIPGWKQTPLVNSDQDASHTHESEKLVSKTESL